MKMEMVLAFLGAIALSALALEIASVALNGVGAIRRGRLAIDIQMGVPKNPKLEVDRRRRA